MLENATRICEAKFGVMQLSVSDGFRAVALQTYRQPMLKRCGATRARVIFTRFVEDCAGVTINGRFDSEEQRCRVTAPGGVSAGCNITFLLLQNHSQLHRKFTRSHIHMLAIVVNVTRSFPLNDGRNQCSRFHLSTLLSQCSTSSTRTPTAISHHIFR